MLNIFLNNWAMLEHNYHFCAKFLEVQQLNIGHVFFFFSRDLSYTKISTMPYSHSQEGWLRALDLRGARHLHTFDSHLKGARVGDQAFLVLNNVSFNYHAHCCQLKRSNYFYYSPDFSASGRKREISSQRHIFQRLYDHFFGGAAPHSSQYPDIASDNHLRVEHRYKRQTTSDGSVAVDSLTCLNYTDLNIVLFPDSDTTESGDIREMNNSTDLPIGWFFHPNSTDLICTDNEIVNITTQVYRPCTDENLSSIAPSHTVSALLDISPTPTIVQMDVVPAASLLSTMATSVTTTPVPADSVTPTACSSSIVEVFCTLTPTPSPITTDPPTTMPTLPPCDCLPGDIFCSHCVDEIDCEDSDICASYQYICNGNCNSGKRKRRYSTAKDTGEARMKRDTSDALQWFYPNPDNMSFVCINSTDAPVTTTTEFSISTALPTSTIPQIFETCKSDLFADGPLRLHKFTTICTPLDDPFNPCEDLLGKSHVLRSFIWIVIILALVGNFLVIIVFLGYIVIIRRTKIELFVVHFFYFNLAIADFLMGVYLFTIAVQDLRTLGDFSMFDVAWRTEGGCGFAGFCAITSTMVSVYILLVITVERLYTFSRALQKSHTSKTTGMVLMAVGWGFGILMGILPTVGVSDYTKTAICLPFDVSSKLALSYVLFLLLFTGVVFSAIALCYIIIFYQVFYRQKTTISSVSDNKRWKVELKVALRMGTLVLTNFICWFPIALLGISAAVGNSLVNNITFAKWVMVFIFPINACLNPILYSILSKVFRDNLVLILGKCGLCSDRISKIRRHRAGFTPSVTSNHSQVSSEAGLISNSRRGTIIEQLRTFSISSTTNLLGRRSSVMSQVSSEEHYQIDLIRAQRRRSSEYSSASSEDILGVKVNSRRGSAFSGGSMEEMTTFSNPGFRSSSPVGGSTIADGAAGNHKGSPHPRISLGAVPEENETILAEISIAPGLSGEDKQSPAYLDNESEAITNTDQHNVHNSPQVVSQYVVDSGTEKVNSIGRHDSRVCSIISDSADAISNTNHETVAVVDSESSPPSLSSDPSSRSQCLDVISIEFD